MPLHLKHDNFDILLLYSREDHREAKEFQRCIQRDCRVTEYGKRRNPVIKAEDELNELHPNPTNALDFAYGKALFVFLFVTQEFCKHVQILFKSHACLTNALEDESWCVVPVQTEDERTRKQKQYILPMMLRALNPINYWDKDFYKEALEIRLGSKMSLLMKKNLDLQNDRLEYFHKNKEDLICLHSYRMSNPRAPKPRYSMKEQDEKPKLNSLKMKGSHSAGELQYGSVGCRSDPSSNRAYFPHPGPTYSETSPNFLDSDLHMHTANPALQSGRDGEDYFNVQEIENALPFPVHSSSQTSSSSHPSCFSANSDRDNSTEMHAPLSSSVGRGPFHQESHHNLTSENPSSDQRTSSDESGLLDSKEQTYVTASSGSSTETTNSGNPLVHDKSNEHKEGEEDDQSDTGFYK